MSRDDLPESVRLETVERCLLCRSRESSFVLEARDILYGGLPGLWTVRRCDECGLMFTSPRPDRRSIGFFYKDDYAPHVTFRIDRPEPRWRTVAKNLYRRLLDPKEEIIPAVPPGRALEVGCASGRFLERLRRLGWEVWGLEPSAAAVEALSRREDMHITVGGLDDADYPSDFFQLVAALAVIEHLHDPLADARKVFSLLEPGGYFMGSVPNAGSWELERFRGEWLGLALPLHLFHFTPESLRRLLQAAGFEEIRIVQQRNVNNLMFQAGRFLKRKRWPLAETFLHFPERGPWPLRLATRPVASALAWMGQAGRITFLARKP